MHKPTTKPAATVPLVDCWGDLPFARRTPLTVLTEQATVLGEKTSGKLCAWTAPGSYLVEAPWRLDALFVGLPGQIRHTGLGMRVAQVCSHGLDGYPATVFATRPDGELVPPGTPVANEEELLVALRAVVQAPHVRRALATLRSRTDHEAP